MRSNNGVAASGWTRGGRTLLVLAAAVGGLAACGSSNNSLAPDLQPQLGMPLDWSAQASNTTTFETGMEGLSTHTGTFAGYLHGTSLDAFGGIQQQVDATPFRGQRVKATAWVTESFLSDAGSFGVGVDAPASQFTSSVSIPAPVGGSDDWHQVFVVFDVPANAVGLTLSSAVSGSGQLFIDDVALAAVDTTTPVTTAVKARTLKDSVTLVTQYSGAHTTLLNAGFELGLTVSQ